MQEHIHGDGSHTGLNVPEADRDALLREGLKDLKQLLGDHQYRESAEKTRDWRVLHQAAEWERFLQLRRDAVIRRRWVCQLQERSQQSVYDKAKPGCFPPIRNDTFKMLVRPVERDFDRKKFILLTITVVTMFVSFASQINQITRLCGTAYMCPVGAGWKYRPVVHLRLTRFHD